MSNQGISIDIASTNFDIVISDKDIKAAMYAAASVLARQMRAELAAMPQDTRDDPSAPGAPPKRRKGKLAKSVKAKKTRRGAIVIAGVPYSAALEVGADRGDHGGHLDARPFFQTSLSAHEGEIMRRLEQAMKTGVKFKETK